MLDPTDSPKRVLELTEWPQNEPERLHTMASYNECKDHFVSRYSRAVGYIILLLLQHGKFPWALAGPSPDRERAALNHKLMP